MKTVFKYAALGLVLLALLAAVYPTCADSQFLLSRRGAGGGTSAPDSVVFAASVDTMFASGQDFTFPVTITSEPNRVSYISMNYGAMSNQVDSVLIGSALGTLVGTSSRSGTPTAVTVTVWRVVGAGIGTQTVRVSETSETGITICCRTFWNANQSYPDSGWTVANGYTAAPTVDVPDVLASSQVVDAATIDSEPTQGAGKTADYKRLETGGYRWGAGARKFTSGTVTMNYTMGGAADWVIAGWRINKAP